MKSHTLLCHLILAAFATIIATTTARAQDEYDYLQYKLFDKERYRIPRLNPDTTIFNSQHPHPAEDIFATLDIYAPVRYERRGDLLPLERYSVEGLIVDYATAYSLRNLNTSISDDGLQTSYRLTRERVYYDARHALYGTISGRNTLARVNYTATIPAVTGWTTTISAHANGGPDIYTRGVGGYGATLAANLARHFERGTLSIAAIVPWSMRTLGQASTDETFTLLGNTLYNPAWGYDGGRMRSARERTSLRPEVIAAWSSTLNDNTHYSVTLNAYHEWRAQSSLAWFDAPTPMPDNYRYLPSHFLANEEATREVEQAWTTNDTRYTQIAWDELYATNALQQDGRAAYVVDLQHRNHLRTAATFALRTTTERLTLDYGITLDCHTERRFKSVDDLLGADHIDNLDYMLMDDATFCRDLQNDLRNPNRIIREGDRYAYDYRLTRLNATLHAVANIPISGTRLTIGGRLSAEQTSRHGYYEKELFPGRASYGTSRRLLLMPYRLFASWDVIHGAHNVSAHAMIAGLSPKLDDLFLQPQYNNRMTEEICLSTSLSAEARYAYHHARVDVVAAAYVTTRLNDISTIRYYDDIAGLYCDAVTSNIDRLSFGIEAAAKVRYGRGLISTFGMTLGRHTFISDARVLLYADANNAVVANTTSHVAGRHLATPSITLTADIAYRTRSGWQFTAEVQYFGLRYTELSLTRRTERILSYAISEEQRDDLYAQRPLRDAVNVGLSISRRIRLSNGEALWLQLSADNLLNSHVPYGGYEPNRVRRITVNGSTLLRPFDEKLTYAYPLALRLAASYRF